MSLWKLRSPKICNHQAGDRKASTVQRQKTNDPQAESNAPFLHLRFRPPMHGMRPTTLRGPSALLWLSFTCASHPETPSQTPQNHVEPNIWAPHSPVKLTHKTDHHKSQGKGSGGSMQRRKHGYRRLQNELRLEIKTQRR